MGQSNFNDYFGSGVGGSDNSSGTPGFAGEFDNITSDQSINLFDPNVLFLGI